MPELYRLFQGEGSAAEVWLSVEQGDPNPVERNQREFFANYYLGLFHQAEGKLESAHELVGAALEIAKTNAGYIGDSPGGQLRAGDIARVHQQQLQLRLADQRAWEEAQKPRDRFATQIAYVAGGLGLAALIGFGVAAQRRKRPRPKPEPALEVEPEPVEPVEELAGKSST